MFDPFLLLAPILVLAIVALLGFVGCNPFDSFSTPRPPAPPFSGSAGDQKNFLTWDPTGYVSFTIKRRILPETSFTSIAADVPAGTSSFVDSQLANGTTYSYIIEGFDAVVDLNSRDSDEVMLTPQPVAFRQIAENSETLNNDAVATKPFVDILQHSLVVVWISYHSGTEHVTAVSDSAGNAYQLAVGPTQGQGQLAGQQQEIWFARNANAGQTVVVTAQLSGAFNAEKSITAHEYTGLDLVNPLDATSSATGLTAPSSGTTNATDSTILFGAAIFSGSGNADTANGFTQRSSLNANASEDKRILGPGPVAATFTLPAAQDWIAQMATFR